MDISISKIKEISNKSPNLEEHNDTPFPQADTFTRVLDLLNYLKTSPRSKLDLSIYYGFDERQSDYYANALKYLGLVQRNNHMFELTTLGKQIASMTNSNLRNYKIIELILSDKIFNLVFCNTLNNNGVFQDEFISNTILRYASRVGNDTANRRKRSVKAWITWIFAQTS